ncbi:MAG: hypothetical protein HQM14_10000 [SAR324 cluster bacterium]|nr:hypothetical protein [SAR324 cluster bacterium]
MTELTTTENDTINLECSCYRNFKTLLEKLNQARHHNTGRTQAQDLVKTFMLGIHSFFPSLSVRVCHGGWYYEHFETQTSMKLPPLSIEETTLTGHVLHEKQSISYQKKDNTSKFQIELELYFSQGISCLQVFPLLDVHQNALGIVEITTRAEEIPTYQQELMELFIQQLSLLLETGPSPLSKLHEKRKNTPELQDRLRQYEEEIANMREREDLFYSLIRYFRDSIRMIDAWRYLKSLTPQNEIGKYDFNQHADFYFQRTYKFAELLMCGYKIQRQDLQPQLKKKDLIILIHESISEFTQYHRKASLNLQTRLEQRSAQAMVDVSLFKTAIVYALEHLFLQTSHLRDNNCLVIEVKNMEKEVLINVSIEEDPLLEQLKSETFDFDRYMEGPLDEYGLRNLFLPFVKLAIATQNGMLSTEAYKEHIISISIRIPKEDENNNM